MTLSDGEKLKQFRENLNLSQVELSRKLDVAQQIISRLESFTPEKIKEMEQKRKAWIKESGMSEEHANMRFPDRSKATAQLKYKLLKVFGYDIEEDTILPAFQKTSKKVIKSENVIKVPFYGARDKLAEGTLIEDYPENLITYFDKRWLNRIVGVNQDNLYIISATDNRMDSGMNKTTDIHSGDMLLFDKAQTDVINNNVYVVKLISNEIIISRILIDFNGQMKLIPNNLNIPPADLDSARRILGKVVWNISKDGIY